MRRAPPLIFLALISMAVSPAHAQDGGPPPEYRGLVDSALAEFDAQHWAEARALFERAHAAFPNARTLRGIGMAAFELRDYVAARRALDAALTEPRRPLTEEQRAQVAELAARARVFVGDFAVGPAPAGSTVDVDGVPTAPEGDLATRATLALAVGAHELTLRAPDGRTARAQVTVHGGETATLTLAVPDAAPGRTPPRDEAAVAPPTRSPATTPADPGAGPWVLIGVGAAVAVAGGVLLGLGASDAATVSSAPARTEWVDLATQYDRIVPLEVSGIVALALGVGSVAGGLAWQLGGAGASTATVAIGPGSLALRGSF